MSRAKHRLPPKGTSVCAVASRGRQKRNSSLHWTEPTRRLPVRAPLHYPARTSEFSDSFHPYGDRAAVRALLATAATPGVIVASNERCVSFVLAVENRDSDDCGEHWLEADCRCEAGVWVETRLRKPRALFGTPG
jgi:hypothetical protein